jgi:Putative Actinobacterial Holin-X, holin superfamily III
MPNNENLGSFIKENKTLLRDYVETRIEIFRLQGIRQAARVGGYVLWIVMALFLVFLFIIFGGITIGYWLSSLLNSYTAGFGVTTLILLVVIVLLTAMRNTLFVNPIIRNIIRHSQRETPGPDAD